jgi:hypothetical protein
MRKIDKSFAPATKELKYLNKSFSQWRQSLIDFAKVYYPNTYTDFNETSPGMMFIEMASYVGDVLSYYIDTQFKENLMQYAEEPENVVSMAQTFGYKPKPSTPASCFADFYQLCPAAGPEFSFEPDARFFLRVATNAVVVSSTDTTVNFRTTEEINFADPVYREISVYAVNSQNQPLTYLVKKQARVVAGTIRTYEISFASPQKFSAAVLPDNNIIEVLSVRDSSGFTWSEVDYLAQDLVLESRENITPTVELAQSVPPAYTFRIRRTPRRFITRYNQDFKVELGFGSGVIEDFDSRVTLQPNQVASDEYKKSLASNSLDPSDFLSSQSYGLAPSNIDMTITYSVGGGIETNVPSNTITQLRTLQVLNDRTQFSLQEQALYDEIVASLAVNNTTPATGGKDVESIEEIRTNALAFFNSQNRLVNAEDYTVRTYAMPAKYGGVAKAFVVQDAQINNIATANISNQPIDGTFVTNNVGQNAINLYVLGYTQRRSLTTLNTDVKNNLKTYLDQYRMLTDKIRILDAFVVNIGVNFKIVVFKNYNSNEVLVRCIDAIQNFFDIARWNINQPIILSDLYTELAVIDGVQSVVNVEIVNKYQYRDGADYNDYFYDIKSATYEGVVYPSLDPCIFELRYPLVDIIGSAS